MDCERRIQPTKIEQTHIVVDGGKVYRATDANVWLDEMSQKEIDENSNLPPMTPIGRDGKQRHTKGAPFSE